MKRTLRYKATAIVTVLVLSMVISCLEISYATIQGNLNPISEANSNFSTQASYGKAGVEEHKITSAELGKLKSEVGVYKDGKNYNQIVNGHGTGLSPPTEKEWADIAQNAYSMDDVISGSSPASVDLSTTPWFPPIGNQANQGSCVAWSVGYYVKTFQEAKEHGWDLSGASWEEGYPGHPTIGYQSKIISPGFIYNLINNGQDGGSNYYNAIQLVCFIGASSWEKMPYNQLYYTTWPSESAWTEAPYYRGNSSGYQYMNINDNIGINNLKNWLSSGNLATIGVDAYKFQDQFTGESLLTDKDMLTLDNYVNPGSNHAATIVGYNDTFSYTEQGQNRSGAFKIANSWGIGDWEKVPDGFYWISYETMKQRVSQHSPAMFYFDSINYQPSLLAKFRINHTKRSECTITVGLGTPSAMIKTKIFSNYVFGGSLPFCANNIVLDITEFKDSMTSFCNQPFFMRVYDKGVYSGGTNTIGTVTYFGVGNTNSTQAPIQTINNNYVNLTLTCSVVTTTLNLSPTSGPPSGIITLDGAGFTADSSVNIAYLNPATSSWIPIIDNLATTSENFTYTMNAPDLLQNNLAGDKQPGFDNIVFRAQDNSIGLSYSTTVPHKEWRRGLAQIGNTVATGLYGNNTYLAASFFVQNGGSILVCGEWFSPGNVSFLWDGVTGLGTILTNETGFFNASVLVPTTTAGQHKLVIRDNSSDFCFNLTRLPTVANDYVDLWHTSDFNINLAPDYSVNETFYKINNGPIYNVTANGQPTITTEGSSNTLEYWSTWDIYGTGSMELSHVTLTGIKLDKTAPTSSITVNSNYVNSGAMVTFDAGGSSDVSGIVSYLWDFGDGTTGTGMTTTHTYSSAGTYAARMAVQDTVGNTTTATVTIVVQTPQPTPSPSPSPTTKPTSTTSPSPTTKPTPTTSPSPTPSSGSSTTPQVPEYPMLIVLFFMLTVLAIAMFTKKGATKIRK